MHELIGVGVVSIAHVQVQAGRWNYGLCADQGWIILPTRANFVFIDGHAPPRDQRRHTQGDEPVTVEVRAPLGPLDDVVAGSVRAPRHSPIAISRGQPRISCDQYEIWLESGQSAV